MCCCICSYEHFYVVYCKFWELDSDHDFSLDKNDLARYNNCALTYQIVERIFAEVGVRPGQFLGSCGGQQVLLWQAALQRVSQRCIFGGATDGHAYPTMPSSAGDVQQLSCQHVVLTAAVVLLCRRRASSRLVYPARWGMRTSCGSS